MDLNKHDAVPAHKRKAKFTSINAVNAENLKAEIVSASASSAAEIKTFASVELDAKASSAGKILYRGGSTNNKVVTSSGGVIKNN